MAAQMQTRAQLMAAQKRVQHQHEIASAAVRTTSRSSSLLSSMGELREAITDKSAVDCVHSEGFEHDAVDSGKDSSIGKFYTLRTPKALKNELNFGGHGLEIARSESSFSRIESDNDQDTPLTRGARFHKHTCITETPT